MNRGYDRSKEIDNERKKEEKRGSHVLIMLDIDLQPRITCHPCKITIVVT